MWHGQTCYISQIKTKRVGAWPLWIFSMVAQIFNVFKFIFAKSSRRKIFFCWGHTNTLGTFLRRSPLGKDYQKTWTCRSSGLYSRMSRAAGALNLVLTKIFIKDIIQDVSKWDLLQIVHGTKSVIFLDIKSTAFFQPVYCHRSEMWKSNRWGGSCRPTCAIV